MGVPTGLRTVGAAGIAGLLLVGVAGVASAPVQAATTGVAITAQGFTPRDVTIAVGDTVTFTNSDSAVHVIEFKPTTGVTCTPAGALAAAGGAQSCTFASDGTFSYSDPNARGNTFRGTVKVVAPASVPGAITLTASKGLVVYGARVVLSGVVKPAKGQLTVDLYARPYPETAFVKVATATTQGDGAYSFALPPQVRTEYRTQYVDGSAKGESPIVVVAVRPKVTLAVKSVTGSTATLRTGVVSTVSYAGKPVLVQRRNSQGGWTTVKTVRLGQFSTQTFKVKAPAGTSRWRVYLQASQAGGGYEASFSPTRRVVR